DEAVPNQLVEVVLLARQEIFDLLRIEFERCRANGLVRFLRLRRLLHFVVIRFLRQYIVTIFSSDILSYFSESLFADADGIGSHVGDEAGKAQPAELFAFV